MHLSSVEKFTNISGAVITMEWIYFGAYKWTTWPLVFHLCTQYTMRVTDGLCIIIGLLAECRRILTATTLVTWDKITMKDHPLQANSNRNLEI